MPNYGWIKRSKCIFETDTLRVSQNSRYPISRKHFYLDQADMPLNHMGPITPHVITRKLLQKFVHAQTILCVIILTLSPPNKLLSANFLSALIFKVLQCRSKLVKMLSECQTA